MGRRLSEVTYFLHTAFPPPSDAVAERFEFIDGNFNLKRLLIRDQSGNYKYPWHEHPLCVTSKTKLLVRSTSKDVSSVRLMSLPEYLGLIGWFPQAFSEDIAGMNGATRP